MNNAQFAFHIIGIAEKP